LPDTPKPSRRSILTGGAIGASAVLFAGAAPAAALSNSLDIWAINPRGLTVPSDEWTVIPWPRVLLNDTPVHLDTDGATWLFPPSPNAIYTILVNIAWDNARSPAGKSIRPPTHRKLMRILQQGTGTPQIDQPAYIGAASDLTYHSDLAARGDQDLLSDGSKGYQQQQVTVQAGIPQSGTAARIWVEVYQDSGMRLACRWDGTSAPKTASRPPVVGLLAPSIMIGKLAPF
jgi:hypothetical protein